MLLLAQTPDGVDEFGTTPGGIDVSKNQSSVPVQATSGGEDRGEPGV